MTTHRRALRATVAAKGDPGYAGHRRSCWASPRSRSALDGDRLPDRAGVLTPATAIGTVLADRLRAQGFEISVRRDA